MDLAAQFDKQSRQTKGKACPVVILLDKLDEKNRAVLAEKLESNYPPYLIAKVVRAEGLRLSEGSVRSHRERQCKCAKKNA